MLDSRRENIKIAVVIEIRKNSRSAVGNRIDARYAGDVGELLPSDIQIERITLVAAE